MLEKIKKINIVYLIILTILIIGVGYGIYSLVNTSDKSITVTGTAAKQYANQISTYYLTLEYHDFDKAQAVEQLNEKTEIVVNQIKDFGIDEKDIKTQNLNLWQNEEPYIEEGVTRYKEDEWYASYSLEVTLRDLDKSKELTSLLTSVESANLWGPNLSVDQDLVDYDELLTLAIEDAREKAEKMASSVGRKVGKVLEIQEGEANHQGTIGLMEARSGLGGGAPVEPGSSEVSRSVTVTFELKLLKI
jgi:uncharacterized protein YggE